MLGVLGGEQQRHRLPPSLARERLERGPLREELRPVAAAELGEERGVVAVRSAELGGGSQLLPPGGEPEIGGGEAARP